MPVTNLDWLLKHRLKVSAKSSYRLLVLKLGEPCLNLLLNSAAVILLPVVHAVSVLIRSSTLVCIVNQAAKFFYCIERI